MSTSTYFYITVFHCREEHTMLSWGNINLFDFQNRLLSDSLGLNLWGVPKGNDDLLNPLGSTGTNPNSESPNLSVEFEKGANPIEFPDSKQIREYAEFLARLASKVQWFVDCAGCLVGWLVGW